MSTWQRLISLVLTLVMAAGTFLPPGVIHANEIPSDPAAQIYRPDEALSLRAEAARLEVIRQAYDLLLDRYVQPLNPAELLQAAYAGVASNLISAGARVKEPTLQLPGDREQAWSTFQSRMDTLLKESPPPAEFSPTVTAIAAMTRAVDEAHTGYMTQQQYQEFLAYLRGDVRYGGIGLRPRRPGVTVAEVFPDSPAKAAGVMPGDVIVQVDGQSTRDKTLEEVSALIRGPEGTAVSLVVDRPRTGEKLSFLIVRASIRIEFITTDMIQDSIAYIRLRAFMDPSVADQFEAYIDSLPSRNAKALVIDLRGNPGGRVDIGLRLLNRFIPSGAIFRQVDRTGRQQVQSALGPGWSNPIPVVILIDEASASMSEIFASAMRERGVARVIGAKSAGAVSAAQIYPLSDGSAVQVTILEITSGEGQRLNRVGVVPDDVLASSPAEIDQGRDVPLEAAVLYLWEAMKQPARATAGR